MGLIREPRNVDFIIESKPWTKEELDKFREIMKRQRETTIRLKAHPTNKRRTKSTPHNKV
jgi:hypothetical protein